MTDVKNNVESPTIKQRKGISAVWLVPIIALVFGGYLAVKALQEQGVMVSIEFETAAGLVPNKTEIRYKGLKVGVVRDLSIKEDLQSVSVEVEMHPLTQDLLTDQAQFWYVTADVSVGRVTGLDTLLSGSYINFLPPKNEQGEAAREFIALTQPPALDQDTPGLHITLNAPELGSINVNSPVTYKQLNVGNVTSFEYDNDDESIDIHVFIKPEYAHLVKESTRFWNASGINIQASLSRGIRLKTQSLESLLFGGIAFENLTFLEDQSAVSNGKEFKLHPNHLQAQTGHKLILKFDWDAQMDIGVPIMFHGVELGEITQLLDIDQESQTISAEALVDPRLQEYLTDQAQFYVMSPQISLAGVQNLNAIMSGTIIGIRLNKEGEKQTVFNVLKQEPPFDFSEPGLHLMLRAKHSGSLARNSGVYYQKKKVGTVQQVRHINHEQVDIQIHILPQYTSLVNDQSRFWNASGFRVRGNLQGIDVQAESFDTIVAGGIAFSSFVTPNPDIVIKNGDNFVLHDDINFAEQQTTFTLALPSANNVKEGTRILYQGREIGAVHGLSFKEQANAEYSVKAKVGILPEFAFVLKENTRFWLVKPTLSLSGISDTDALLGGTYISLRPGNGEAKTEFIINDSPPERVKGALGLQLRLIGEDASSVSVGSPITYKSLTVGQVDHIELTENNDVGIAITINEKYRHLISMNTRFYNASGINFEGNLSDIQIHTESIDSILRGGISFYNPPKQTVAKPLAEKKEFHLFTALTEARNAGFAISIEFNDASGLSERSQIKYQKHVIGRIVRIEFKPKEQSFIAHAFLVDEARPFVTEGSKFWLTRPNIALVGMRHPEALLQGNYVTLVPSEGEPKDHFKGLLREPVTTSKPYGLNLTLTSHKLGSIKLGNPVMYRQVKVGEVIGVDLANTADQVNIYVNIYDRYKPLVTAESKFWNFSGVRIDAGLFSGVKVDTDSMESIIAGGIAFATPSAGESRDGMEFKLHPSVKNEWLDWQPVIELKQE